MFTKDELKSKKLNELKQIAKDNDIKLPKAVKKDELVSLLAKKLQKGTTKVKAAEQPAVKQQEQTFQDITPNKIDFNKIPELPYGYGKDKLVFMIKDPNWGFVYWEFSDELSKAHNIYDSNIEKFKNL